MEKRVVIVGPSRSSNSFTMEQCNFVHGFSIGDVNKMEYTLVVCGGETVAKWLPWETLGVVVSRCVSETEHFEEHDIESHLP